MTIDVAGSFPALGRTIYLNTAAFGVGCDRAAAALVGARAEDIALIPTASAVAGQVGAHLAHAGGGGTLLVGAEEYTSNLFAWKLLEWRITHA